MTPPLTQNILIAVKNLDAVVGLKALLSQKFDMKDLGAAKKILGMEIHRDRSSKKLWLSQQGYVEKVLDRFGMSNVKPVSTPLANHFKLSSNQCPKIDKEVANMAEVPYASVVSCLMYVMVCTRPDLAHVVSQVSKYMSNGFSGTWEVLWSMTLCLVINRVILWEWHHLQPKTLRHYVCGSSFLYVAQLSHSYPMWDLDSYLNT